MIKLEKYGSKIRNTKHFSCLSDDVVNLPRKSMGYSEELPNASTAHSIDDSVDYMYSDDTDEWYVQTTGGGGALPATGSAKLTKDIIANIDVGNTKSGYVFKKGMTFDQYVEAVHVTYLAPVVNLLPAGKVYEIGTTVPPFTATVNVTKKSKDISSVELFLNTTSVKKDTTLTNGGTLTANISPTTNSSDFTVQAVVKDGTSTVTKTSKYSFVRYGFYGCDSISTACSSSNEVRALKNNLVSPKAGDKFTIQAKAGDRRMTIALPGNLSIASAKYIEGMNLESKNIFNKQTIQVEGKNGYSATSYNVYTYIVLAPFTSNYTLDITLG